MSFTVEQIASWIDGIVEGQSSVLIDKVALFKEATITDLTYVRTKKELQSIEHSQAGVIIVPPVLSLPPNKTYIKVMSEPEDVMPIILERFLIKQSSVETVIHPTVQIGQHCSIAEGVYIGEGSVIENNVVIEQGVHIGERCHIKSNVVLHHDVRIGSDVEIHAGAIVGGNSFEYVQIGQQFKQLSNIGTVLIEDHVHIGSNTTIDRGTIGNTVIKRGTKIDNLVQIGHEVEIGENCVIVAQVGIAGWTKIGNQTTIYGQTGIAGNLQIGNHAIVMAKSAVTKNIADYAIVSGDPAMDHKEHLKSQALIKRFIKKYK